MLTVPLRELKIVFVLSFHNNYSKEILYYKMNMTTNVLGTLFEV